MSNPIDTPVQEALDVLQTYHDTTNEVHRAICSEIPPGATWPTITSVANWLRKPMEVKYHFWREAILNAARKVKETKM